MHTCKLRRVAGLANDPGPCGRVQGTFVYTSLSVDGGRATGEFSRVAAPAHGPRAAQLESSLGWRLLASSAFGKCVPRGALRVSWTEAAQLDRATREFSRVAVPWRGKLKVAADFRYGVWAGDVELAWENVHVGSQRLLPLCSVSQSVSSRPPPLVCVAVGPLSRHHSDGAP